MDRSQPVAIVIPAFNEAASIAAVIDKARGFGTPLVVDDGSSDDTGTIAERAGAVVVTLARNAGYDGALDAGFARASELDYDFVITMDADGQHNPLALAEFITRLRNGSDVVIGSRDRRQRVAEHVFAWVAQTLWGIHDPLCGMKGYRMAVYRALGHFDSFGSIGTELATFAARSGYRVTQIPIQTRDRIGAPRFGRRLVANWRIFRAMVLLLVRSKPSGSARSSDAVDRP
jgi:glycosyltransferase involved in cell wall biosynthesis